MIAHINTDGLKQTVEEHLVATANKAKELGTHSKLANFMFLIGLLHDLGKGTSLFEEYLKKAIKDPTSVRRGEVNHSTAGGKLIYEKYYHTTGLQKITSQLIATIIASHHGIFDCLNIEGNDIFNNRMNPSKEIYYEEASNYGRNTIFNTYDIDVLFQEALQDISPILHAIKGITASMGEPSSAFFMMGCLERLGLSILIDADRLDTAKFMNGFIFDTKKADVYFWESLQYKLNKSIGNFTGKDRLTLLRSKISDECYEFGKEPTGIYCLPIPTGGGKTLSGLRYAIEHAKLNQKERIIYIAPFLSILEQNAEVIRKTLDADEFILEHHSNVIVKDIDYTDQYQSLVETWDSPMVLTTMVQFLNVLFSGSSQYIRRMHQLTNSVIIIDEVQSLPIKVVNSFNTMVNFLNRVCNATIILCSATQPLLDGVDKKILYGSPSNMIQNVKQQFKNFKRTEIIDATIKGGYDKSSLRKFIINKMSNAENMLIILNTKTAVKVLALELENLDIDVEIIQLTTFMCAEHRRNIINDMKIKLKNNQKLICVSTQLIEAGVDISFQNVIRSLSGLDNIAQAAGRCNRNGESDMGYVYIVNFKEEVLTHLQDIKIAQEAMNHILNEFKMNPAIYDNDLLMPKAMNTFYELYFYKRQNEMDYTLPEVNTTFYDLLAVNPIGQRAYEERNGKKVDLQLKQAFKYAGDHFEVIGSNTIGLLVPYSEGINSIEIIKSSYDIKEIKRELKKMQRYTVNIYKDNGMIKELEARNALDSSVLDGNIVILREGFYNDKTGISSELESLTF